jgi:Tol biopolymer transport system component
MTATGTAEALGATPSADVCLHSHPAFWPRIYVMDADGMNVRPVSPVGVMDAWDPSWSPDGSQIVFGGFDGQDDGIFIMDRDGTNVRRLTDGEGDDTEPAWAPDGTRTAFVRQHPDPGERICTSSIAMEATCAN